MERDALVFITPVGHSLRIFPGDLTILDFFRLRASVERDKPAPLFIGDVGGRDSTLAVAEVIVHKVLERMATAAISVATLTASKPMFYLALERKGGNIPFTLIELRDLARSLSVASAPGSAEYTTYSGLLREISHLITSSIVGESIRDATATWIAASSTKRYDE